MSLGSKVFFALLACMMTLSIVSTYYRYIVIEDYEVFIERDESGQLINTDE